MDITIVTCLYDIRAKETTGGEGEQPRTLDDYLGLGNYMLSVKLPMVVYTDNTLVHEHVMSFRKSIGLEDKTTVVWLPFEETFFYKDVTILTERMKEFCINNWNKKKDTPLYVTLNNNKFDFLTRTIQTNPYNSSFFFWMDYGIQHCAKASDEDWMLVSSQWPEFIRKETERVHHLRIHTVTKPHDTPWKEYFKMIYHHIAGSMFGGHVSPLQVYIQYFREEWERILYEEKWWQLDEAVMTIVVEKYPQHFRLWYGDYDGLITNFIHSKRSWELIFQTGQRHLDNRKYDQSEHVLVSLDSVMETVMDGNFRRYMNQRICNDYYRWNARFSPALEKILCQDKMAKIPTQWLQNQMGNIRHYHNSANVFIKGLWYWRNPTTIFLGRWIIRDERNKLFIQRWNEFFEQDNVQWIPIGNRCLSALALLTNKLRKVSLPLDYIDINPHQLLRLFRRQFKDFYSVDTIGKDTYINPYGLFFEHHQKHSHEQNQETFTRRIHRLYEYLESSNKIVFLHTTETFLMHKFSDEEQKHYDESLVEFCNYIRRNFPTLQFVILCIYTNRQITIPFENLPKEMIPLLYETPYEFAKNPQKNVPIPHIYTYRDGIYESVRVLAKSNVKSFLLPKGEKCAN